jgi:Tfp pilus assembly protein PilW
MALGILAVLMAAVAVAFDASVKNYEDNRALCKALNTARAALLRITNDLRTAGGTLDYSVSPRRYYPAVESVDNNDSELTVQTVEGKTVCYRYDSDSRTLYYDDLDNDASYVLCENVTALTFNGTPCTVTVDGVEYTDVRGVRISMTVTDENGVLSQTLAAAAVVRRNL